MCLSYIGGKSRIGPQLIIPNIPKDIEIYVEVFGGMFWNFFKMDAKQFPQLKKVIYNDFNPLNVNLFNCVKNYTEFSKVLEEYPSQKSEIFYNGQKEIFDPNFKVDLSQPDYHTAAKYAYILSQCWSGTNPEKAKFIDLKGKYKSKFDTFKDKLKNPVWQKMFSRIDIVENLDFEDLIKKYDADNVYFYLDPPYFKTEDYYANHEFGIETHERLAKTLQEAKAKWSLSYYEFPQLHEWFPEGDYRWARQSFAKAAAAKAGKKQNQAVELLIMNY